MNREKNTSISERIQQFVDFKGFSLNKFSLSVGASNSYFNKLIKNNTSIGSDRIEKILREYPEINPSWLIIGEGEMLKEPAEQLPAEVFTLKTDTALATQLIPLYNLEASAGLVELFNNYGSTQPLDTIKIPNLPKSDGALFVTGDSMYPLLKSGDMVVYKQVNDFANDIFYGEMYLISVDVSGEEYVTVKFIQKSKKGDEYVTLVSQNQHHQPKDVLITKIRALALIKATIRINSMQ